MDKIIRKIADTVEQDLICQLNKSGMMYRLFSRVKTEKSIRHKMEIKGESYRAGKSKIQDIIGLRVVLYFQDDVDVLSIFLGSGDVVKRSIDEPDSSTFSPQRLNLTRTLPAELIEDFRKALPEEFAQYIDDTYEIQIRTIFSEGWHEVEHDLRYKCKSDWEGCEAYSRTLNGVIATLETAEWSMKSLFQEMAYQNYRHGNYRAMLRNKMRLRLKDDDFSPEVMAFLKENTSVVKALVKVDRMVFLLTLLSHKGDFVLTYDNILFLINRIEIMNQDLQAMESDEVRSALETFLGS